MRTPEEIEALKKKLSEERKLRKLDELRKEKEMWENLKPFNGDIRLVPELPIPMSVYYTNRLVEAGAIPKEDLVDQKWYYGDYRNSKLGLWDAKENVFKHKRYKFGNYSWDTCKHFEDDDNFALFVPLRDATEEEIKEVLEKQI